MKNVLLLGVALLGFAIPSTAQVNSGSDGHDGALNPTANLVIDMTDHPDGIYHYTSVNIPSGVTVTFKPNAANSPVVWLVQGDCSIWGVIDIAGKNPQDATWTLGASGGPGGFKGGNSYLVGGGPLLVSVQEGGMCPWEKNSEEMVHLEL